MTTGNSSSSNGIGVFGLMGVMFIGLKIAGVINWPWIWVLAPFWGSILLAALVLFIAAAIVTIANR